MKYLFVILLFSFAIAANAQRVEINESIEENFTTEEQSQVKDELLKFFTEYLMMHQMENMRGLKRFFSSSTNEYVNAQFFLKDLYANHDYEYELLGVELDDMSGREYVTIIDQKSMGKSAGALSSISKVKYVLSKSDDGFQIMSTEVLSTQEL